MVFDVDHSLEGISRTGGGVEPQLLTVAEVARQLRVDTTTVRRWIALGALEAVVLPHRGERQAYRIRRSALDAILHREIL